MGEVISADVRKAAYCLPCNIGICGEIATKTRADSPGYETSESSPLVRSGAEVRCRPEHDSTQRVEGETHADGLLVAESLHDLCRDSGKAGRVENELARVNTQHKILPPPSR